MIYNRPEGFTNTDHLEIEGVLYVKGDFIIKNFNITYDRLRKWRNGRGEGKVIELRTFRFNPRLYFYCLDDIKLLIDLTDKKKNL